MFKERINAIRNWWEEDKAWRAEFSRYSYYFPILMPHNGLLIKGSERKLDPLVKGLFTSKDQYRLMKKLIDGSEFNKKEKRGVREAAFISGVGGWFETDLSENEGLNLRFTLDEPDAVDYLAKNISRTNAFLGFSDGKHFRHKKSPGISIDEKQGVFELGFPDVNQDFPVMELYIHTASLTETDWVPRFERLSLNLIDFRA